MIADLGDFDCKKQTVCKPLRMPDLEIPTPLQQPFMLCLFMLPDNRTRGVSEIRHFDDRIGKRTLAIPPRVRSSQQIDQR